MTIKQKQHLLAYLGYYDGPVDGIWGEQSRQATEAFQRAFGLTPDGILGPDTEKALRHAVAYGIPETEEPTQGQETNLPTLASWWGVVRHFDPEEFRCPCGICGGFPVEPHKELVLAMDEMREELGVPVIVVPPDGHSGGSGVRCQAYNDSLPGSVPNSRHVQGKAADFSAPGVSASTIEAYLAKIQKNGIIRYWYEISPGAYHMDVV